MPRTDGYTDNAAARIDAMRHDAARRVDRMEQRARMALENNNSYNNTARDEDGAVPPVSRIYTDNIPRPSLYDTYNTENVPLAGKTSAPTAYGDAGEQLFLALLIFLLIREKSDPCLIAALIYLML